MGSTTRLTFIVPRGLPRGDQLVTADGAAGHAVVHVGTPIATGIHQVDNPAIDTGGRVFLTNSGARGQREPVSLFCVPPDGEREDYLTDIVNATSMAFDAAGVLHVSSRFEGVVYRVQADRSVETVAGDLGIACGIAFSTDGTLFVGDRSGTVFRVGAARRVIPFATLPSSMAAFHLAAGPDGRLYVTAPTFGTYDHVYCLDRMGAVTTVSSTFGRPQGIAVDEGGDLYVVDSVAGGAGLYRLRAGQPRELMLSAPALVGVALDPRGGLVVSSNDTAYRLDVPVKPFPVFST
jgi:sugar lactone lactonase YvrE